MSAAGQIQSRRAWLAGCWVLAGLILVLAALLSWRCVVSHGPFFGLYHDDALYVVTARALAEGRGYQILSLPGEPWQTKYPILYPLVLAFLWRCCPDFPANVRLFELSDVLIGFSFVLTAVGYLLRTRRSTAGMAVVILGATLLNIKFQSFLPMTMSDLLYGLLSAAALWTAESAARGGMRSGSVCAAVSGATQALAALARMVGVILLPLCAVYLLLRRRLRAALLGAAIGGAVVLPYCWWNSRHALAQPVWLSYYTSYSGWMLTAYHDIGLGTVVARKLSDLFMSLPLAAVPPLSSASCSSLGPLQFFLLYRVGVLGFWTVLTVGVWRELRHRRRCLLAAYFVAYWLSMVMWPGFLEWRLVLVVLPFVYYFCFRGFRSLSFALKKRLAARHRALWKRLCAALALGLCAYLLLASAASSIPRAGSYPRRLLGRADITAEEEYGDVLATYAWIRANTQPSDVFVCLNDPLLYLHAGRKAVQPSPLQGWRVHSLNLVTPETVTEALRQSGATYLLVDPSYGAAYQAYAQYARSVDWLSAHNSRLLRPVHLSGHGVMWVYRVDREALETAVTGRPYPQAPAESSRLQDQATRAP